MTQFQINVCDLFEFIPCGQEGWCHVKIGIPKMGTPVPIFPGGMRTGPYIPEKIGILGPH